MVSSAATRRTFSRPSTRVSRIVRAEHIDVYPVSSLGSRRASEPTVGVVMPTLNEVDNLVPVIQGLPSCVTEIIVVDGRSTDDTVQVALDADPRVRVILERRRGKGAAMLTGFASATTDVIVAIDADGSMDPGEVSLFQATLARGYDLVKGSRAAVGGSSEDFSRSRRLGNAALTRLANTLHGTRWSDMCYGYFGFWRDALPALDLCPTFLTTRAVAEQITIETTLAADPSAGDVLVYGDGFEIETVLFLRAARAGLKIAEVPSREAPRHMGTSNLRIVRDGTRVLSAIGRERTRRARASGAPATGTTAVGPIGV